MCGYLRERECVAMANSVHVHSKNDRVDTEVSMGIDVWERSSCLANFERGGIYFY
jgi:hypothetical protein